MIEVVLRILTVVTTLVLVSGLALWIWSPLGEGADPILHAGLILLMATPVARLLSAVVDEIRLREWRFVALGFGVLALLFGSLVLAFF